jgi:hypothetical protein
VVLIKSKPNSESHGGLDQRSCDWYKISTDVSMLSVTVNVLYAFNTKDSYTLLAFRQGVKYVLTSSKKLKSSHGRCLYCIIHSGGETKKRGPPFFPRVSLITMLQQKKM